MRLARPELINSTWLGAGLVVLTFCAVLILSSEDQQRWLMGVTAISISALHLFLATAMRPAETVPAQMISAMAILAGTVWIVSGTAMGANLPAKRDGSVLIVLGGLLLALVAIRREPRIWLTCLALSSAVVVTGLIVAPEHFSGSGPMWSVSALTATTALVLISYPFSALVAQQLSPGRSRGDKSPAIWLWSFAGLGMLGLALSLVGPGRSTFDWWLPVISGGMLAIFADQHSREVLPVPKFALPRTMTAGSLVAMFTVSVLSAGISLWLLRDMPSNAAHGVVTVAVLSLIASGAAFVMYGALHPKLSGSLASMATALLRQSRTDALTGLPNRRALDERLEAEIQRAARFNHPLTIGLLDIDDFKSVNDTWGHQAGDAVLKAVAIRMQQELRTIDVVGRFGGEEFLMILPETDIEGAWIASDRLLRGLREMAPVGETELRTTASVGLAAFPMNGRNAIDLLAAADGALYAAKRSGKNQVSATSRA